MLLAAAWLGAAAVARADSALAQLGCLTETMEATVTEVVDVRTLRLADGSLIRIAGIEPIGLLFDDAEEAVEAALKKRVAELTLEKVIAVQPLAEKTDRYGRTPAIVSASGALVQETLVREGLAVALSAETDPLPCFERILAAEAEARRQRRGFWTGERLPEARPRALASRIGHFAIFEGDVASVRNRRARTYLNFGDVWSADVTAEIEADDREPFGGELALEQLAGKRVRLRGFIEERGGPVIALSSPMQLEILGFAGPGPIAP